MNPVDYSEFIDKHRLCILVICYLNTEKYIIDRFGDTPIETDLLAQLFGDEQAITRLNKCLEGQRMPQMWSQGEATCVICKPDNKTIIGAFTTVVRDPVEKYNWSKELNMDILSMWN